MSWTVYIVFVVVISLILLILYLVKKEKIQKQVKNINTDIEKDNDQYVKLMTKIINDNSFKIIKEYEEFQVITFDHLLFDFGDVNWKKLSKNKLHWLIRFFVFLLEENNQYPVILVKNEYLLIMENSEGMFATVFLNKNELKKHLKYLEKIILKFIKQRKSLDKIFDKKQEVN